MATPRRDEVANPCDSLQPVDSMLPRKASSGDDLLSVPQTNTGGWGEYPKALERTLVKELGKLPP